MQRQSSNERGDDVFIEEMRQRWISHLRLDQQQRRRASTSNFVSTSNFASTAEWDSLEVTAERRRIARINELKQIIASKENQKRIIRALEEKLDSVSEAFQILVEKNDIDILNENDAEVALKMMHCMEELQNKLADSNYDLSQIIKRLRIFTEEQNKLPARRWSLHNAHITIGTYMPQARIHSWIMNLDEAPIASRKRKYCSISTNELYRKNHFVPITRFEDVVASIKPGRKLNFK